MKKANTSLRKCTETQILFIYLFASLQCYSFVVWLSLCLTAQFSTKKNTKKCCNSKDLFDSCLIHFLLWSRFGDDSLFHCNWTALVFTWYQWLLWHSSNGNPGMFSGSVRFFWQVRTLQSHSGSHQNNRPERMTGMRVYACFGFGFWNPERC